MKGSPFLPISLIFFSYLKTIFFYLTNMRLQLLPITLFKQQFLNGF